MKLLIVLALVSLALAMDRRCDENMRGRCRTDLCDNTDWERCPRYIFYECPERDDSEQCMCRMYRNSTRRALRDPRNCMEGIERCRDKECDLDSDCKEFTEFCKENDPRRCLFDRRLEAKCIKRSCKGDTCERCRTCELIKTRCGTRPKCTIPDPRNCSEKMCSKGLRCEMKEKKGKRMPWCRNETSEEMCRNIRCQNGWECRNATCVKMSCDDLRCGRDYECKEIRMCTERINRCVRRPTRERSCKEIDCDEGFECRMRNRTEERVRRLRPVCASRCPFRRDRRAPRRYDELTCREDEDYAMCETENRDRFARCRRRDDCRDERLNSRADGLTERRRRPPWNCSEIQCWIGEECRIFNYRTMRIASCVSDKTPKECNETRCAEGEVCHVLTNVARARHAVCFWNLSREIEPQCEAERCEELRCEGAFTCFRRREDGRWRARCRRSELTRPPCCWNERRDFIRWWRFRDDRCRNTPMCPDATKDRTDRPEERRRDEEERRRFEERQNRPDQCLELECCRNERCSMVTMEDGRRHARCVPTDMIDEPERFFRPRTCDELECEEGFTCRENRESIEERNTRRERERREDSGRDMYRRDKDNNRDRERKREERDREDRRSCEDRKRAEERRREDEARDKRRQEEDRKCDNSETEVDETREDTKEDDRCERRTDERTREDRERKERRRREDRERLDERRRQNRERDGSRRDEDRELDERRRREDRDRENRRRDGCPWRGARCMRELSC